MTWTTRPRSKIGDLSAITCGSGPNVLLLHGVGLRAEAWGAQFGALPARMIAPDMLGHGESRYGARMLQMDDFIAAALTVLDALEGPSLVVGHSMGAMLALAVAARSPDQVAGVVALNAVFERSSSASQAVQARAADLDGLTAPDPTVALTRWFGSEVSPERKACESWLTSVDPKGYKAAYTSFAQSQVPSRDMLAALRCPALFMTGSEEPNSTPAMSEEMAELAPQGRALIVEGAAHMMPMTHPVETNAALAKLIDEVFA